MSFCRCFIYLAQGQIPGFYGSFQLGKCYGLQWDELKEKCEALELGNSEAKNELTLLQEKVYYVNSLQEEVDRYDRPSILVSQIIKLTTFLADAEECQKKASKEVAQACRAFEADRKVLQQKKDELINVLRGLEEEVDVAQQKSQESLQRPMNSVYRVQDQILEHV